MLLKSSGVFPICAFQSEAQHSHYTDGKVEAERSKGLAQS